MSLSARPLLLLAAWLALAPEASGQCSRARAEAWLDGNDVRARVFGDGALFYRGAPHVYAVPKHSGSNAVFHGSIWVAGLVDGMPRAAAGKFGLAEFSPGPLLPPSDRSGAVDCDTWDRLFQVTADDFRAAAGGVLTDNLRSWPWQAGAPVVDGDGKPGNYEPGAGDRPELIGEQRIWWVMHDETDHHNTGSEPLGIEVQASAMAPTGLDPAVDQATLWRFRVINRSDRRIDRAYMGLFMDTDLGDHADDYVGMDTTLGLAFTYNADDEDGGDAGYGSAPPAFGLTLLEDADGGHDELDNDLDGLVDEPGERVGIGHFMPHDFTPCITCDPGVEDAYKTMTGRWQDGTPIVSGGRGHWSQAPTSARPVRHAFPGDPVTRAFWSEVNADSAGGSRAPGDRRWVLSAGPFRLEPGGEITFTWAMVFARGLDHLDSITQLRRAARGLLEGKRVLLRPATATTFEPPAPARFELGVGAVHPNPADERASMRFSLPLEARVRLSVIDLLGRERIILLDGARAAGIHDVDLRVGDLEAGVYFIRLVAGPSTRTQKLAVVR